jgi:hypothetical protein
MTERRALILAAAVAALSCSSGSSPGGTGGGAGALAGHAGQGGQAGTFAAGGRAGQGGAGGAAGAAAAAGGGSGGTAGGAGSGGGGAAGAGLGGAAGGAGSGGAAGAGGAAGGAAGSAGSGGMAGAGGTAGGGGDACTAQLVPVPVDCTGCTMVRLDIQAQQLVADPQRGRLYLTVGGAAPACPNRLVILDATTLAPLDALSIGSNPNVMALSDDASTLWVGIDGALAIRKLTLTSNPVAQGPLVAVPHEAGAFATPTTAGAIAVLPGAPTSIALETATNGSTGTYLLDDGVPRSLSTQGNPFQATVLAAGPAGYLFGYDGASTGYEFFTYTVISTGIGQGDVQGLASGFGQTLVYDQNRVYVSSGDVIDVSTPTFPKHTGMVPAGPLVVRDASRLLVVQASFETGPPPPGQILLIDKATLKQVDSFTLPSGALVPPRSELSGTISFVYAGGSRVAILQETTDSSFVASVHLFLVDAPTIAEP